MDVLIKSVLVIWVLNTTCLNSTYGQISNLEIELGKLNYSPGQYFEVNNFDSVITIYSLTDEALIVNYSDTLYKASQKLAAQIKSILADNFNAFTLHILYKPRFQLFKSHVIGWIYPLNNFSTLPQSCVNQILTELSQPLPGDIRSQIVNYPLTPDQFLIALLIDNSFQVHICSITKHLGLYLLSSNKVSELIATAFYKDVFTGRTNKPVKVDVATRSNSFPGKEVKLSFTFHRKQTVSLNKELDFSSLLKKYPLQINQYFEVDRSDTPSLSLFTIVPDLHNLLSDSTSLRVKAQLNNLVSLEPNILPLKFIYFKEAFLVRHLGESGEQILYVYRPSDAVEKEFFAKKLFPPQPGYYELKKTNPSLFKRIQNLDIKFNQYVDYTINSKKLTLVTFIDDDPSYLIGVGEPEARRLAGKLQLEMEPDPKREIQKIEILFRSRYSKTPAVYFQFTYRNGQLFNDNPSQEPIEW